MPRISQLTLSAFGSHLPADVPGRRATVGTFRCDVAEQCGECLGFVECLSVVQAVVELAKELANQVTVCGGVALVDRN
jgi:hypothetical protein